MAENGDVMIDPEIPPRPETAPREPFLQGSFAMFTTDSGDVVLATNTNLMGDQITKVPRFVVNQAKRANPMLAALLKGETPDGMG
jgi:hypothetical protein